MFDLRDLIRTIEAVNWDSAWTVGIVVGVGVLFIGWVFKQGYAWWTGVDVPNLNGTWVIRRTTEVSSYGKYVNMELEYVTSVLVTGGQIRGTGEKDQERSVGMNGRCDGPDRVVIELDGTIQVPRRGQPVVNVQAKEYGRQRQSMTTYDLKYIRRSGKMKGRFFSTAGDQLGYAVWTRRADPV